MSTKRAPEPTHQQLVDHLAESIQGRIIAGDIPVGTWLRQEHLAIEFGVSRTPVREALQRLAEAGMLNLVRNRGALVQGPTAEEIREAYAVRAELEGLAAALAAMNISASQLRELKRAEEMFRRSVDSHKAHTSNGLMTRPQWVRANDLFHEVIHEAAGNLRLAETIRWLHRTIPRNLTWSALSTDRSLLLENVEQHRRIRSAIESRRPNDARRSMLKHLSRSGELVASWFEEAQRRVNPVPVVVPGAPNRTRIG